MECRIWIADELQAEKTTTRRMEEDHMEDNGQKTQDGCKERSIGLEKEEMEEDMEKDMEKLWQEKAEANSEEAKEAKTHMEEHTAGAKERTKEARKEKEKADSLESAIIVEKRGIVQGFARSLVKEKEPAKKGKERASKERVIIVASSDIVPLTAGKARAKEAKEEHTRWNGKKKERQKKKKKEHHVWKRRARGEAQSSENLVDAAR